MINDVKQHRDKIRNMTCAFRLNHHEVTRGLCRSKVSGIVGWQRVESSLVSKETELGTPLSKPGYKDEERDVSEKRALGKFVVLAYFVLGWD